MIKKNKSLELDVQFYHNYFSLLIFPYPGPSSRLRFPLCSFSVKCKPGSGNNELRGDTAGSRVHNFDFHAALLCRRIFLSTKFLLQQKPVHKFSS